MSQVADLVGQFLEAVQEKGVPGDIGEPPAEAEVQEMMAWYDEPFPDELVEFYRCWPFGESSVTNNALFMNATAPQFLRVVALMSEHGYGRLRLDPEIIGLGLVPESIYHFPWLRGDLHATAVFQDGTVWHFEYEALAPVKVAESVAECMRLQLAMVRRPSVFFDERNRCFVDEEASPPSRWPSFEVRGPMTMEEARALAE